MTLNHLALGVTDVPATVSLFETYFHLQPAPFTPSSEQMAFMLDDADSLISLFRVDDALYPPIFRVGFVQPSPQQVQRIHEQLVKGGFQPGVILQEHGRVAFDVATPGQFTVEISAPMPR